MTLSRIEISRFRNFSDLKIDLSPNINVFVGKNGSGKTSFLEAIYYLGLGRSFRSRSAKNVIQRGCQDFSIYSLISSIPAAIQRSLNRNLQIKIANDAVYSISELAKLLPLQLINSDSYQLVTGGPSVRRQFIDWGVFHVEQPRFLPLWRNLQRLLKQRNALLRSRQASSKALKERIQVWDNEFIQVSEQIDSLRCQFFIIFEPIFHRMVSRLLDVRTISLKFLSGWNKEKPLSEILVESLTKDVRLGYTQYGAHRADLHIEVNNVLAQDVLSRGQQKLLAFALQLSQICILKDLAQKQTVLLIDDLPSELDQQKRELLCDLITDFKTQTFVTGIEPHSFDSLFDTQLTRLFHVKHGNIERGITACST